MGLFSFLTGRAGFGEKRRAAEEETSRLIAEAEEQKRTLILEAREEGQKIRESIEAELKDRRHEIQRQETRQAQREETLERKIQASEQGERRLVNKEHDLEKVREEIEQLKQQELQQIQSLAGLTMSEAKEIVIAKADSESKYELALRYREIDREMREEADKTARKVVTLAIHRLATDVVSEHTTAKVHLPNDEMKGRLIGREGRNIRALEALTGVDVIIDDSPELVTISCFDPVRRETARLALEQLIKDGRIHPARIEEIVARVQLEIDETIKSEGEKAVFEAKVPGLNPELVKLLGRLRYRYSYGENVLRHSVEVSLIAGMLAAEIGANVEVAKAGGLLHDIGKSATHEVDGPHAEIGADIARKWGVNAEVHRAIIEHHDEERGSVEAFLVATADAISAARPGARRESVEQYSKRLEELEAMAGSFPGVQKTFAIQAGREVRIMVKPDNMDDVACTSLARAIVKKVEENLVFPGQIKVTVIRETRSVEYAR